VTTLVRSTPPAHRHPSQSRARGRALRVLERLRMAGRVLLLLLLGAPVPAEDQVGLLGTVHRHHTLATTISENGDLNPYAVIVAPVSAGKIHAGDVLIDNFNNISNLQGTGQTIVIYGPVSHKITLFARLPSTLAGCPGGVGLTTAMVMLRSGYVIVGSAPSTDGTTRTLGDGGLIVLDPQGTVVGIWSGPQISAPWGNIAIQDQGATATIFVSMAGFKLDGPQVKDPVTGLPVVRNNATVLRLSLNTPTGATPTITAQSVVADGFGHRADKDAFLVGPTGLALAGDGTLYISDGVANRIAAVSDALTRSASAGLGRTVTSGGLLKRPLAMVITGQGHLLVVNGKNGQVVEVDPAAGRQLYAQWIDTNQAQSPPGNGDLFGLAMRPDGKGFYYVQDDTNLLMECTR